MLNHSKFRTVSIQTTAFTQDIALFQPANVLAKMLGKYANRFDGNVIAPSFPSDVPLEVPRVSLESKDGKYKFQVGPSRIDSIWSCINEEGQAVVADTLEMLMYFLEEQPTIKIGRLAFVINRIVDDPHPAKLLIDRFCNEGVKSLPLKNSENFEIHNHKVYSPSDLGIKINSWVRCKAVTLALPQPKKAVLVEQDINSLPEEISSNAFSESEIVTFFKFAVAETDNILKLYFPDGV